MHRELTLQAAWVQGAILIAICVAIAAAVFLRLQRPFDRDAPDIQVSRLQSHAAEAQLLADNARADRSPTRWPFRGRTCWRWKLTPSSCAAA